MMMINAPASTPVRHLRAQGPRPSRTLKTVAFDDFDDFDDHVHNDNIGDLTFEMFLHMRSFNNTMVPNHHIRFLNQRVEGSRVAPSGQFPLLETRLDSKLHHIDFC